MQPSSSFTSNGHSARHCPLALNYMLLSPPFALLRAPFALLRASFALLRALFAHQVAESIRLAIPRDRRSLHGHALASDWLFYKAWVVSYFCYLKLTAKQHIKYNPQSSWWGTPSSLLYFSPQSCFTIWEAYGNFSTEMLHIIGQDLCSFLHRTT